MKKAISSLAALFLVVTLALPASAASISDAANPESLYPVDIILDLDNREIRKVYDLSPSTDPSTLPMAAFERDGLEYSCTDILREVIIGTETQPLTQTETVESKKKDLETLLSLLPQEREVTTEEGFTGTLRLDLDSIETEVSGYGMEYKEKQLALVAQILKHKVFNEVLTRHLQYGEMPQKETIVEIMKNAQLYHIEADSTYMRRASTVIGWVNWILDTIEE